MTVSDFLEQPCNKSDVIKLVRTTSLMTSDLLQGYLLTARSKLATTTGNKQCEHNLSTAWEQICDNLFADL
jgi:hypothetical protein